MVEYYELDLGGTVRYYLVDGNDAVNIVVASDGMTSTVSTNDDIMDEVSDADPVSESDIDDDIVDELQRGRENLL